MSTERGREDPGRVRPDEPPPAAPQDEPPPAAPQDEPPPAAPQDEPPPAAPQDEPPPAAPQEADFSAGGVVVRDGNVVVIVPRKRGAHGDRVLGLPKGHLDGQESELEAAIREVREETGVEAVPVEKLGEIAYTYERRGRAVDKRVAFYLLEYRAGELSHDHEIERVQWMPLEEAAGALSYEGEREMVRRALSRRASDR